MKSRIGFNGKVSDEGDNEVVVEDKVGNIKRTIGLSIGGIEFFFKCKLVFKN